MFDESEAPAWFAEEVLFVFVIHLSHSSTDCNPMMSVSLPTKRSHKSCTHEHPKSRCSLVSSAAQAEHLVDSMTPLRLRFCLVGRELVVTFHVRTLILGHMGAFQIASQTVGKSTGGECFRSSYS